MKKITIIALSTLFLLLGFGTQVFADETEVRDDSSDYTYEEKVQIIEDRLNSLDEEMEDEEIWL